MLGGGAYQSPPLATLCQVAAQDIYPSSGRILPKDENLRSVLCMLRNKAMEKELPERITDWLKVPCRGLNFQTLRTP